MSPPRIIRIRRNIILNLAFSVLPIGLFIFTVPIYIKTVGLERYGVLSLIWVLTSYVGFMNFGAGDALNHRIARSAGSLPEARERIFWSGFWTTLALGCAATSLVWLVTEPALVWGMRNGALLDEVRACMPWIMLLVLVAFLGSSINGVLEGSEQFQTVNIARLIDAILAALLPLAAAFWIEPSLPVVVAATVVATALPQVGLFLLLVRRLPLTRIMSPDKGECVGLLRFGGWLTVTSVISPIMTTMDRFLIGASIGPAAVSHYVVPQGIGSRLSAIPMAFARTLFPRLSSLGDERGAGDLSVRTVAVVGGVMAPICGVAILGIRPLLHYWIDPAFAAAAAPVGQIVFFAIFFNSLALVPFNHLRATGNPGAPALIHLVELLPFVAALWAGIHFLGIVGAAIAWALRAIIDAAIMFRTAGMLKAAAARMRPHALLLSVALGIALLQPPLLVALGSAAFLGLCLVAAAFKTSVDLHGFVSELVGRAAPFAAPAFARLAPNPHSEP